MIADVRLKLEKDLAPAVPCTSRESSHGQPITCNALVIGRREAKHEGVPCMRHRMIEVDQLQSMTERTTAIPSRVERIEECRPELIAGILCRLQKDEDHESICQQCAFTSGNSRKCVRKQQVRLTTTYQNCMMQKSTSSQNLFRAWSVFSESGELKERRRQSSVCQI